MKFINFRDYGLILFGTFMLAFGVAGFFAPNSLLTGGTAGLSLLLHYVTNISIGSWMVIINIPLLLLGLKNFGKEYVFKSIITILLISFFIDFLIKVIELRAFVLDRPLSAIFGGIFVGIGLALILKGRSSAGGTTIIALIVAKKTEMKAGNVILILDGLVLFSSLFVFEDRAIVLWSIISIYVTSRIIDTILTGRLDKKIVHLVTDKVELIRVKIREELGPYGTIIEGEGLYRDEEKRIIMIVVETNKLQTLRSIIKKHDPEAFLIIAEASEMLGRDS